MTTRATLDRYSLVLLFALMTNACAPAGPEELEEPCHAGRIDTTTAAHARCEQNDGVVVRTNIVTSYCACPTQDGGKACTHSDQCEGDCSASSSARPGCEHATNGRCATTTPSFGCVCVVNNPDPAVVRCVD